MKPSRSTRLALDLVLAAGLAVPALSQTSFTPGDTYYRTNSLPSQPATVPGVLKLSLSPPGWQLHVLAEANSNGYRAMCYDPWRDRLLVYYGFGAGNPPELWAFDAAGGGTPMGLSQQGVEGLAATGDGRVYFVTAGGFGADAHVVRWIDAAGAEHTLLDATGTAPLELCPLSQPPSLDAMFYEAATQALYISARTGYCTCPGGNPAALPVYQLPLSADGTRLSGPIRCADFDVDGTAGLNSEACAGISRLPDGDLLVIVDTASFGLEAHLLRLDPTTMTLSPWSLLSGPPFPVGVIGSGMWSSQLGGAVVSGGMDGELFKFLESPTANGWDPNYVFGLPLNTQIHVNDGWMLEVPPPVSTGLFGSPSTISIATGGRHDLTLDADPARAGQLYAVLGSLSGSVPGIALHGVPIPLNYDLYTQFTLDFLNSAPFFSTLGVLDAQGHAQAGLILPPAFPPAMAGMTLTHAAITFTLAPFQVRWASNPVPLQLVP